MKVEYTLEEKDIEALKVLADIYHGPCAAEMPCEACPFCYNTDKYCIPEAASELMTLLRLDRRAGDDK